MDLPNLEVMKGEAEDIEEILYDTDVLHQRISQLGHELAERYKDKAPLLLSTLKGCFVFFAGGMPLLKPCPRGLEVDFLSVHSYGSEQESSGTITVNQWCTTDLTNRHVLLVDDICDSGLTLLYLVDALKPRCASLTTVVLLNKTARRKVDIIPDYVCFECPDRFVVGYGMDLDQRYRTLSFVGVLKQSVVNGYLQNGRED